MHLLYWLYYSEIDPTTTLLEDETEVDSSDEMVEGADDRVLSFGRRVASQHHHGYKKEKSLLAHHQGHLQEEEVGRGTQEDRKLQPPVNWYEHL